MKLLQKIFNCVSCTLCVSILASCHSTTIYTVAANKEDTVASPIDVGMYGFYSVLIAAVLFIIIAGIASLIYRLSKDTWNGFWKTLEHRLTNLFVLVWLFGFAVYLVGTSIIPEGTPFLGCIWRLTCQSPMAMVHAFQMFVLQSDVSAINSEFHGSLLFMSCFSLAHFLAACVSLMFIIKYFGYNLVAKFRLSYRIHIKGNVDELYVFWGMNDATYCLAKDIEKQYTGGKFRSAPEHPLERKKTGSYEMIILKTPDDDENETEKEHTAVERLFSFISFKKEELDQYKELGCLTVNVFNLLTKIKVPEGDKKIDVIADEMDIASVAKLIKKTDKKVHVFFLGNDENDNIIGTTMLCRDTTIDTYCKNNHKVSIYCHARYDSINRVIEDKYSNENIEVKVLDSSHDSINILRSNKDFHPINFVDIDTEENLGTVKSDFTSLVVGLGETGRDAVRFLYEYGAFVDYRSSMEDDEPSMNKDDIKKHSVMRSPFRCYVADKDANRIKGHFLANAPAIKGIETWNTDILTPDFYDNLNKICKTLNYVVMALGDDELNITTAVHIFNYIRRHRADLDKFKIFIRCHNSEMKKHLQHIAEHYNQITCGNKDDKHIEIFGTEEELYTYEQVIENDYDDEGVQYNKLYCDASGENGEKNQWKSRHRLLLKDKKLDKLSELRRKESQDIANAYHALTKLLVINKVTEDENGDIRPGLSNIHDCLENIHFAPQFPKRATRDNKIVGTISAEGAFSKKERLLFRNLARLEHLRWNAAHEVLGYQSYKDGDPNEELVKDEKDRHGCNEQYRLHNCLIDWQDLDAEMNDKNNTWHSDYKRYDFIVITTTFLMNNKNKRV